MGTITVKAFYDNFGQALQEGSAAIFAGAGLSRPSGYVDWPELLREIAKDLGLDVDRETDLVAIAQYHLNKRGSRGELDQLIVNEFTKNSKASRNHEIIANMPIHTVWTTNYDTLLEDAFKAAHRRADVKVLPASLTTSQPGNAVTIYKMHGDVLSAAEAVLTKEDYETFDARRGVFSIKLKGDLLSKTFLFLGFSFSDPNIDYILARIRALVDKHCRQHYCVMRWPTKPAKMRGKAKAEYEYERKRLELRIGDLGRYGIQTVMVNEHTELTPILEELSRRSHLRDIFVSGSAHDYSPLGKDRLESLAYEIGKRIAGQGCNVVSGFGLGIGSQVTLGSLESLMSNPASDIDSRLFLRPFPQTPPPGISRKDFWTKYRREMLQRSGACIFLAGNKLDANTGNVIEANGMMEEFEIACALKQYPIPIGATGHTTRKLWQKVTSNLNHYFPKRGVKQFFNILGDEGKTNEELLDAVFGILKQVAAV